jgi:hypothetical protein
VGILPDMVSWLEAIAKQLPPKYKVCELGDQFITYKKDNGGPLLARLWFKNKGSCGEYVSIDANGLNGALPLDLNMQLHEQADRGMVPYTYFDLVTDFGTGEHVFDQRQIWQTLHALTKPGGYIIFDRPSEGYDGHCFYLIEWNLITAIAHANGYEVLRLEERRTSRGILMRGLLRKRHAMPFRVPQQGRYVKKLRIPMIESSIGPDWRSRELRAAGVIRSKAK